ncbi:hypothetical protein WA026_021073 [Henosepilachna vigintioctopunctata]|uniref:Uncharacterized protein n=1 Tax=Henosepilachna vigintioctopunctata TaxID=420089 RepID=A0AAW1UXS2_9CUCU
MSRGSRLMLKVKRLKSILTLSAEPIQNMASKIFLGTLFKQKKTFETSSKNSGTKWFTGDQRMMISNLKKINFMYNRYKTEKPKTPRNRMRNTSNTEIKTAKIRANDNIISKSTNMQRTSWSLIDKTRNTSNKDKKQNIIPEAFLNYIKSIPNEILNNCSSSSKFLNEVFKKEIHIGLSSSFSEVSNIWVRNIVMSWNSKVQDIYDLSSYFIWKNIDAAFYLSLN